ncbi:lysylphosphatidylglycerol synthase transmembrane domain-containing protein [Marinomonas gallaica]|uniref:lysylphosphatidylglycerol synthase transmembrane domain-containing protein n=1 Tax=Marinomonas gallaica TaxID=1806667 RepID=UPI003A8E306F
MNHGVLTAGQIKALVFSVTVAVLAYLLLSLSTEWQEVLHAYQTIGWSGLGVTLALSLVNYGLRFIRWQMYLSALGHRQPWLRSAVIYFAGFALTTTPGKAGEMLRGVFLKPYGMPYVRSTAAFLSERLSDLFAVVLLCLTGVTLYKQGSLFVFLGLGLIVLAQMLLSSKRLMTFCSAWLMSKRGKLSTLLSHLVSMLLEARRCHRLSLQIPALLLSLVAWSAEAYAFYLILNWTGFTASYSFAFSVYALSMLAGALSFLPGGLGGAEAIMIGLLLWAGMGEPQAIAATVVIRLVTLWFAVGLGCFALLWVGKISPHIKHEPRPSKAV